MAAVTASACKTRTLHFMGMFQFCFKMLTSALMFRLSWLFAQAGTPRSARSLRSCRSPCACADRLSESVLGATGRLSYRVSYIFAQQVPHSSPSFVWCYQSSGRIRSQHAHYALVVHKGSRVQPHKFGLFIPNVSMAQHITHPIATALLRPAF